MKKLRELDEDELARAAVAARRGRHAAVVRPAAARPRSAPTTGCATMTLSTSTAARRHDHHRHVRRGPLRGRARARGPRLLRHRQPAADAHRQGRRARARAREADRGTRSSSTCARGDFLHDLVGRDRRAAPQRRHHARAVPRRGRRRARAPLRGEPPPPPAVGHRPRQRRHRARARAARAARRARPTSSSTRRSSTCTSCATGCASCSPSTRAERRAAGQRRVVRLQARPAARRRPRVRLPLPARTRTGSRSCARSPASTRRCATTCSRNAARREFLDELDRLFALLAARATSAKGKAYLSIGVGCTGGRHRSVVIAEQLAERFARARLSRRACTTGTSTVTTSLTRGPSVVALGGGHGSRSRCAPSGEYAGDDHRGRERRRRRRLVGPAAPRPRRAARRATCARAWSRSPASDGPWPARVRAPLRARASSPATRSATSCIVGLAETLGDLTAALDEAGRLLGAVGRVVPATTDAGRR